MLLTRKEIPMKQKFKVEVEIEANSEEEAQYKARKLLKSEVTPFEIHFASTYSDKLVRIEDINNADELKGIISNTVIVSFEYDGTVWFDVNFGNVSPNLLQNLCEVCNKITELHHKTRNNEFSCDEELNEEIEKSFGNLWIKTV